MAGKSAAQQIVTPGSDKKTTATNDEISRRCWLATALAAAAAVASPLLPYSALAQGKISKSDAEYQDRPKGMQMCGMCKYFVSANGRGNGGMMGGRGMMGGGMGPGMMSAGSCELVEGSISPMGWCKLYAPSGT
ncbi:MAG: hypothetical protein ACM3OF_07115 [Gemmatimonas sp.]|jgi:hypothetical protein